MPKRELHESIVSSGLAAELPVRFFSFCSSEKRSEILQSEERVTSMLNIVKNHFVASAIVVTAVVIISGLSLAPRVMKGQTRTPSSTDDAVKVAAIAMIDAGRETFRFDTFGDEAFWGDALKLHRAIIGQKLGGVGPGVSRQNCSNPDPASF